MITSIKLDTEMFQKSMAETKAALSEKLKLGITALASYCVDNAKKNLTSNGSVVTGNLRRSIGSEISGGGNEYQAVIIPKAKSADGVYYGKYVEYGRPPIVAKNAPYLTFQTADGSWHRVAQVAATPAKPFLAPAVEQTRMAVKEILNEVLDL